MKIQVLSDLHLEFENFPYQENSADVVVLAGDIHVRGRAIEWIEKYIPEKPVVYVLGNHEYYGKAYPKHLNELKQKVEGSNIHILENECVQIHGVNFFGCTLWTDFELYGDPRVAGYECQSVMNDFKKIRLSPQYSKFRSLDAALIHNASRRWLVESLSQHAAETNIVVTHHGPSERSLVERKQGKLLSAGYVSRLDALIEELQPSLWCHGHLHQSSDYHIGATRVVCNPRGYPDSFNSDFKPDICIEVVK